MQQDWLHSESWVECDPRESAGWSRRAHHTNLDFRVQHIEDGAHLLDAREEDLTQGK